MSNPLAQIICTIASPLPQYALAFIIYGIVNDHAYLNRKACIRLLNILFFSMVANAAFKCLFQIPLNPAIGKNWYAFPSGHMQAATVFLGWLALELHKKWMNIAFPGWLLINGWAMHTMEYHNNFDMIGGFISGLLLLWCYRILCKNTPEKNQIYFGFLLGTIATMILITVHKTLFDYWASVGILFGGATGLTLAQSFLTTHVKTNWFSRNLIAIGEIAAIIFCIHDQIKPLVSLQLYWFLLGFFCMIVVCYSVEKTLIFLHRK